MHLKNPNGKLPMLASGDSASQKGGAVMGDHTNTMFVAPSAFV